MAEHFQSRPRPEKPAPDECCGRGCEPCILDYYERALAKWRAQNPAGEDDQGQA